MKVKVCGLNDPENINELSKLNIDLMGFVFHYQSPRNVLYGQKKAETIRKLKHDKVGVFVDENFDFILQTAFYYDLQYIQLHGNESPKLMDQLKPYFKVIKAFSIADDFDFSICEMYNQADLFVFDTKGISPGGNGEKFNWDLLEKYTGNIPFLLSGGITLNDVKAIKNVKHNQLFGIDVNSGFEHTPGEKKVDQIKELLSEMKKVKQSIQDGYYGEFGGAYIPELLVNSIHELQKGFDGIKKDLSFEKDYKTLLKDYAGRPTPLYYAKRLSEKYEANIYLKREDLNHTGAHKINNTIGQALLAKRMGKTRIIAETGAGQHGVATATVCALLNIECVVYMGAVDMVRQKPNVNRMKMLGAEIRPATSGSQTLKDATNEAIRDWINNPDSFYLIGSVVGPHPYPEMVAYFQSIISSEMKRQLIEKTGNSSPDSIIACVGGGSNAAGAFYHYLENEEVDLIVVEAAGLGIYSGKSAATSVLGSIGVIHGSKTLMMQDEFGQIIEPHSISAGLDYPGIGPLHAHLIVSGRAKAVSITDDEALSAGIELTRKEGIIPALESAHALAALDKLEVKGKTVVVNLSGRGDKDLVAYLTTLNKIENEA